MATNVTLSDLILRTRQRADMEKSLFVSDSEITTFINDEINELYAKAVNVDDGKLFSAISPTVLKVGNNAYQMTSRFMRLVDVNIYTGSQWVPAYEADPQEHFSLLTRNYSGDHDVRYYLKLNQDQGRYELFLFPAKAIANIAVSYIPEAPVLSLVTDTLKWPSNWAEGVVLGAAIKCLEKEESESMHLHAERDRVEARMLKDIRSQSVSTIQTLRDIAGKNRHRGRGRSWGY